MATGGAEKFSFHSLQHRVLKFAKRGRQLFLASPTYYGWLCDFAKRTTKKAANLFQTYCFRWPRRWRLVFSFENSFHIGMINGELLRYVFKRKRLLLEYIPQNMPSLYSVQCNIYIVFQQLPFFRLFHLWTFRNQ